MVAIPRFTYFDTQNIRDVIDSNNFVVFFDSIPSIECRADPTFVKKDYLNNKYIQSENIVAKQMENLTHRNLLIKCTSCALPQIQMQPIEVKMMGFTRYFTGLEDRSGQITLTFVEDSEFNTTQVLLGWRNLMSNYMTGSQDAYSRFYPFFLSPTCRIGIFDSMRKNCGIFSLNKPLPITIAFPQLEVTTSAPFVITVTLAYSSFFFRYTKDFARSIIVDPAQVDEEGY